MAVTLAGRSIVSGRASGVALVSSEPLSFWGGYDHRTGEVIDRRHPLNGQHAGGCVLVIPYTRGSSTTTAVLLEAVRAGTAPAAVITLRVDTFLALAAVVADEMYGRPIPLVAIDPADAAAFETGQWISVREDGVIEIRGPAAGDAK